MEYENIGKLVGYSAQTTSCGMVREFGYTSQTTSTGAAMPGKYSKLEQKALVNPITEEDKAELIQLFQK